MKSVCVIAIKNINISWIITLVYPLHAAQFTLIQSVSHAMSDGDRKELEKETEAMSDQKTFLLFLISLDRAKKVPFPLQLHQLCPRANVIILLIHIFPSTCKLFRKKRFCTSLSLHLLYFTSKLEFFRQVKLTVSWYSI